MSISYKYFSDGGYILTTVSDIISLPEVLSYIDTILEYIDTILEDSRINTPFYEIVDFAEVETFDFGYYQSGTLYDKLVLLKERKNHLGTIFIASKDLTIGMSNIFRITGEDKGMNIQIVNNFDEALQLIKIKNT